VPGGCAPEDNKTQSSYYYYYYYLLLLLLLATSAYIVRTTYRREHTINTAHHKHKNIKRRRGNEGKLRLVKGYFPLVSPSSSLQLAIAMLLFLIKDLDLVI
jgi:hypothetical protein